MIKPNETSSYKETMKQTLYHNHGISRFNNFYFFNWEKKIK